MIREFLLLALAVTAAAQDPVKLSPDYKVEIDNAWVRVLRVKHPPHAKIALHEHSATVAVFLTDVHEKITAADGTVAQPRPQSRRRGFQRGQ